jgi:arginine-tRNA-protein transferase
MSNNQHQEHIKRLAFYATPLHECSYLPDRRARTLFADPQVELDMGVYDTLIQYGFRRSGTHIYRPSCPDCQACVPIRLPVDLFRPDRSQRRNLKTNQELELIETPAEFDDEQYQLYRKYIHARHTGGSMDDSSESQYLDFLTSPWSDTVFIEFRHRGRLLSVAVIDRLASGLSAVYTFFDPDERSRGLGTLAVLQEIELCRQLELPYLYLGYWIESCAKMSYKARFSPRELFCEGQWNLLD